ncbi:MAG: FAD-binding protein [Thermoleophilaceae bacterium]
MGPPREPARQRRPLGAQPDRGPSRRARRLARGRPRRPSPPPGAEGAEIAIAGGFHAMGGQQFRSGGVLLDTRPLDGVLGLDRERGVVEVEAGVQWPGLMRFLEGEQSDDRSPWAIVQKQSGADRLSIAGSISANAHGRGLDLRPMVADVESLVLVGPDGEARRCSRTENAELFGLAIGGYGLFGVIVSVALRLRPREKLERVVEEIALDGLMAAFGSRIDDGYLYGDFQFSTDERSESFLRRGVFSCYRPVDPETPVPEGQRALAPEDWEQLILLAHVDKAAAYDTYVGHYLRTSGQVYLSDAHQMAEYADGYHAAVDRAMGATVHAASEMITEIYVPRGAPRRLHGRGGRGLPPERCEPDLRHHPAHPPGRGELPGVGPSGLRVRDLQPPHRPHAGGRAPLCRGLPTPDRHGHRPRRVLLPHLPPLRDPRAGGALPPALRRVPAPQARARPRRASHQRLARPPRAAPRR